MRTLLGAVVFLLGIGALGLFATTRQADVIEAKIADGVDQLQIEPRHEVAYFVSGRDISLFGTVDSEAEAEALLSAYRAIDGVREVRTDWTVLPAADPYVMAARWQDGRLMADGYVPDETVRDALAGGLTEGSALTLASGAPEGWAQAVEAGLKAAVLMEEGEVYLEGQELTLNGIAMTPAEGEGIDRALQDIPEAYAVDVSLEYLDDGTPPEYVVTYDASLGLRVDGKLPKGLSAMDLAGALDFVAVSGEARTGLLGDSTGHVDRIAPLADWLPEMELLTVRRAGDQLLVTGEVGAGVDAELVAADLSAALGQEVALTVAPASAPDGARRTNAATGVHEIAQAGYWLPVETFEVSLEECAAQTEAVQSRQRVTFLTGSARLDGRASRAVNAIGAVALHCLSNGALRAEIGGHTDNVGDPAENMSLSEARANTVRAALIARGVPADLVSARGYGDSEPVVPNETEEGRATNRRTTITWSAAFDGVTE